MLVIGLFVKLIALPIPDIPIYNILQKFKLILHLSVNSRYFGAFPSRFITADRKRRHSFFIYEF